MFSASASRTVRLAAALLAVGWGVVFVAGRALGVDDPISIALLLGIGTLVPVGLTLLPPGPPSALAPLLPALVPLATSAGAASLALGPGPAGGLAACLWVSGALVLSFIGAARVRRALGQPEHRAVELGVGLALMTLPIGAAWLVMSRLGVDPMGVSSLIVLCTAVHFHFTSFCLVVLVVRALGLVSSVLGTRILVAVLALVTVSIPLIAAGWSGVPVVLEVGVWMLAAAVVGYGLATLVFVVPRMRVVAARVLLGLSCLAPLASMPLAVLYVEGEMDLDTMVNVHGMANAYGLVGLGLLAQLVESRVRR